MSHKLRGALMHAGLAIGIIIFALLMTAFLHEFPRTGLAALGIFLVGFFAWMGWTTP